MTLRQKSFFFIILSLIFTPALLFSQKATVIGVVTTLNGKPIELSNISIKNMKLGTVTDKKGYYSLKVPAGKELTITVSFIGYRDAQRIFTLQKGEKRNISFKLQPVSTNLPGFEVKDEKLRTENLVRLNPRDAKVSPAISSSVEGIIQTLPGVASNNEMSSQYSVRGGNFDENLVYVNGIEIYRPFLVNTGQQEGLSFINPALVSSILFSAGGFGAQYGDKMSSVMDVKYIKPINFGGSFSAGFLGADIAFHGTDKKNKFTYLIGARYKTNSYLLKNLDTKGNYKPAFFDLQSLFTYKINNKWQLSLLGYYSRNKYQVIPTDRETNFGTLQEAYRFKVYFDGKEVDNYDIYQSAFTISFHPNNFTDLKIIASAYSTDESETYDIQGQYWIGLLENNPGNDNYGKAIQTSGVGTYLHHARNKFIANVINIKHLGSFANENHFLRWGLKYSRQFIDDKLREWEMIDSAGYSLPHQQNIPGNLKPNRPDFKVWQFVKGHNRLYINRFSGFISNEWKYKLKNDDKITLTGGIRGFYWDFAKEFLVSPRINFSYKPHLKPNFVFRFASGIYYQPPFYREMRNMNGSINYNIKSQRSIHFILGSDYRFQVWNRPFILTTELYYKKLDNLIPYEVDNVRIRYYANELAKGYAAGIDFKIYGEFVKGVDSWVSLSIMKTAEDIIGDYYYDYYNAAGEKIVSGVTDKKIADSIKIEPGYIPRPTDRRVNFSIFFQDFIPNHPTYKVHLRLLYGTGFPFGAPNSERYQQTFRMPDYRRVDIGFAKQFISNKSTFKTGNPLNHISSMWLSLEVFNLFQVYNTISYIWVKDVDNRQFAVPNYLTPRLLNVKLSIEF